jgi:hypothetical protein
VRGRWPASGVGDHEPSSVLRLLPKATRSASGRRFRHGPMRVRNHNGSALPNAATWGHTIRLLLPTSERAGFGTIHCSSHPKHRRSRHPPFVLGQGRSGRGELVPGGFTEAYNETARREAGREKATMNAVDPEDRPAHLCPSCEATIVQPVSVAGGLVWLVCGRRALRWSIRDRRSTPISEYRGFERRRPLFG